MDSKEEAIKKAGQKMTEMLAEGKDFEVCCYPVRNLFVIDDDDCNLHNFPYSSPRQFPPKGTLVKWIDDGCPMAGFVHEDPLDSRSKGLLCVAVNCDDDTTFYYISDWIELQEVPQ